MAITEKTEPRILLVDGDPRALESSSRILRKLANAKIEAEQQGLRAVERMRREQWNLVIADTHVPGHTGVELLERARHTDPELPFIIVTASPSLQTAIQSLRLGASDYLSKPIGAQELLQATRRLLECERIRLGAGQLLTHDSAEEGIGDIIGRSASIRKMIALIARVAPFDIDILITGETGTGKELAARYLHQFSDRSNGPFIPVDTGAIPSELIEREFFGHEAGAFTGARSMAPGLFEAASGGTIFLDEIGNLPMQLQAKLLRVLQERRVRRLGAVKSTPTDIRVIAAASVDLVNAVEQGLFRRDLYHRLNVVLVQIPPLRQRTGDIPLLTRHFLSRHDGRFGHRSLEFASETIEALEAYPWPGNVRELENMVQRVLATCPTAIVHPGQLPSEILSIDGNATHDNAGKAPRPGDLHTHGADLQRSSDHVTSLDEVVRDHILTVLEQVQHNRTRAAKILGIDPKTLRRKLRTYGLDKATKP